MLVQLYLERQEVQELFVLHLQIPDNPGQEIISGEIVHFVWAVAEDIADYMEKWLDIIKSSVAVPTFASYSTTVKKIVAPYFREKEVTLKNLTAKDIQEFYLSELERVSPSSVIHYHANIHKALKYAVKIDLIDVNPADKVERPKKDRYVGSFYDADEVNALFEAAKGSKLELPILFGAFYGLRRSEAIGLKWDAIDFDQNTITIRHTVTSCDLDGKRVLVASDTTKTKSSMRTLPLVPFMRERLLTLKEEQQENRRLCGRSYIKDYLEYVCVNEIGDLIKPHYVTESFPKLLKAKGMRQIRYLVLGIRPEFLSITGGGNVECEIYGAMPTGMESTVKVRIGEYLLTGVVFGSTLFTIGSKHLLDITGSNVMLFDRSSGRRITSGTLKLL